MQQSVVTLKHQWSTEIFMEGSHFNPVVDFRLFVFGCLVLSIFPGNLQTSNCSSINQTFEKAMLWQNFYSFHLEMMFSGSVRFFICQGLIFSCILKEHHVLISIISKERGLKWSSSESPQNLWMKEQRSVS